MESNIELFPITVNKSQIELPEDQRIACIQTIYDILNEPAKAFFPGEDGETTGSRDLCLHGRPQFASLFLQIQERVQKYWNQLLYTTELTPQIDSSWANVHRKGNWTMQHCHNDGYWGSCHISGVYYIHKDWNESDIEFIDPLDLIHRLTPSQNMMGIHSKATSFETKTGDLLLFPSWLSHRVNRNKFDEPRIAISFNYKGV